MTPMLLVCAPLRTEARALRRGFGSDVTRHRGEPARVVVHRSGFGMRRSACSAAALADSDFDVLVIAGLGGGLTPEMRSGDIVVGSQVRGRRSRPRELACRRPAEELRSEGFAVHTGPIVTTGHLVHGAERAALADTGALVVDMESAELVAAAGNRPVAVVRIVLDTPREPLLDVASARRAVAALQRLRHIGAPLVRWATAIGTSCADDTVRSDPSHEVP
ncbi:4-hydroxy-3-methylbut-2-enyl diphosphate reductase [Halopolyspora algeriensis]|uniref:4-hydroxy-3-methylbut-2-enyl diphosphate reductase n=1 Tax=Halopolyspora algeriensis TaxID=1500506 RepID=A0A368W0R9_9ACTN|nr:hypothetical protein [Halopolyspora algeriensis]RCW46181.1 4-hydroxy-3-methylbut-2-enyl diphosphate reductase [Halopolyspora algeriensis]TQM55584.1 4-hydroxy-3-methylbut-2-enyl diphosphate reductase [Halopolyspora algeriensis]